MKGRSIWKKLARNVLSGSGLFPARAQRRVGNDIGRQVGRPDFVTGHEPIGDPLMDFGFRAREQGLEGRTRCGENGALLHRHVRAIGLPRDVAAPQAEVPHQEWSQSRMPAFVVAEVLLREPHVLTIDSDAALG